eukprot:3636000-Alexandrium_andersonii.AAC.1
MMLVCVLRRSAYWGNPAMHATWEDESLNAVPSKVGSTAHSQVWSRRILAFSETVRSIVLRSGSASRLQKHVES